MRKPLFGAKGINTLVQSHPRNLARLTRRPGLEFTPQWLNRLFIATSRKVNGRKVSWRDLMTNPHGLVLGPREFGHFRDALRTDDKKVHAAPPEFVARARELLAEPRTAGSGRVPVPAGEPAQPALDELLAQRAARAAPVR